MNLCSKIYELKLLFFFVLMCVRVCEWWFLVIVILMFKKIKCRIIYERKLYVHTLNGIWVLKLIVSLNFYYINNFVFQSQTKYYKSFTWIKIVSNFFLTFKFCVFIHRTTSYIVYSITLSFQFFVKKDYNCLEYH